ncbi:MAG: PQQ-binding-like beta-propeller repeat protein [Planctomycetota bacterium]|nr:PQQ-binding-like beta-propeller repeat protein [Planctomycetota bacterium]
MLQYRRSTMISALGARVHPSGSRRAALMAGGVALAFGLVSGLSGCEFGPSRTLGPAQLGDRQVELDDQALASVGYKRDWTGFPFLTGGARIRSLEIAGDGVMAHETGSTLSFLDAANGSMRWSNTLAGPLTKFVGNRLWAGAGDARGPVVVAASESTVYHLAIDTGNLITQQRLSQVVNTSPLINGNVAIFGTPRGEVIAHLLTGGLTVWAFDTRDAIERQPAVVDGAVAFVNQAGRVVFLDPANGNLLGAATMWAGCEVDPVAAGTLLVCASLDQSIYAFNSRGQTIWRQRTSAPLRHQPTAIGERVYCATADGGLTAFDAATGRIAWTSSDLEGTVIGTRRGRLLLWDGTRLTLVDENSGSALHAVELPGFQRVVVEPFADGPIYATVSPGVVFKMLPR